MERFNCIFFFSIFSTGIWYFLHEVLMRFCRITVNPLLSPPPGGGLSNSEKTMVSVLHKDLECKVEKLKYKKVGGHATEDQNQIQTSRW